MERVFVGQEVVIKEDALPGDHALDGLRGKIGVVMEFHPGVIMVGVEGVITYVSENELEEIDS